MTTGADRQDWDDVLDFWFPEARALNVDAQTHRAHWRWRMRGGADAQIIARFSELTERAARCGGHQWPDPGREDPRPQLSHDPKLHQHGLPRRRPARAPARVTLRHSIWCGRELIQDLSTHTNREEAQLHHQRLL